MPKIKKTPTEQELLLKLSARCATTEYCRFDIVQKAVATGVSPEVAQRVADRLADENFINEERFVKAFVHDKFELQGWGKAKISAALRQKRISSQVISTALEAIDPDAYCEKLKLVLSSKNRLIRAVDRQERTRKLASFAASRGFEIHLVLDTIDEITSANNEHDEETP